MLKTKSRKLTLASMFGVVVLISKVALCALSGLHPEAVFVKCGLARILFSDSMLVRLGMPDTLQELRRLSEGFLGVQNAVGTSWGAFLRGFLMFESKRRSYLSSLF